MFRQCFSIGLVAAALSVAATAETAAAQDTSADATYGTVRLSGGFTPDPYTIRVMSGGSTNARDLGGECRGYIATRPDVRLHFDAGSLPLIISAVSDADTTLVINGPDGRWYCDDDSGDGLNPAWGFEPAQTGRYEIWVGTYGEASNHEAVVHISELYVGDNPDMVALDIMEESPPPAPPPARGIDVNATAIYGEVNLRAGFTPDPYLVNLSSGGVNDASELGGGCRGYVASAPDFRLTYTSGTMPLYISVDAMADTTLVVNAPNGQWYCNDDGGEGLNPSLLFHTPLSGRYEIWVGTYGAAENHGAELNISELYSE